MFADERQEIINEILQKNGAVTTAGLVKKFGISVETVRRDLLYMEQSGLLKRVHGGAVVIGKMQSIHNLNCRNEENIEQKRELARAAAELICEGDIIGVDTGSTAIFFANALKEKFSRLTIITHSLDVFEILGKHKDFSVILCGGVFDREENSFYGSLTLDMMSNLNMQKVFIFPSAVSLKHGICDYSHELLQIQKKLLECSDTVCILADSSKFEKQAMLKLDDMRREYIYVTDSDLTDELLAIYEENHITIKKGCV